MACKHDDNTRLLSLLRLPELRALPEHSLILDAGCAEGRDFPIYSAVFGTASIVGVDWDAARLLAASRNGRQVWLVQGDINRLPFRSGFDLVLARHPDLDRRRSVWAQSLRRMPLNKGGLLVISAYTLPEIEQVQDWLLSHASLRPVPLAAENLAPPGLAGRDRFVLVYRQAITLSRA